MRWLETSNHPSLRIPFINYNFQVDAFYEHTYLSLTDVYIPLAKVTISTSHNKYYRIIDASYDVFFQKEIK
jgi:hypothetical protein